MSGFDEFVSGVKERRDGIGERLMGCLVDLVTLHNDIADYGNGADLSDEQHDTLEFVQSAVGLSGDSVTVAVNLLRFGTEWDSVRVI